MEYLLEFIHREWKDVCILDHEKCRIKRTNIDNEYGSYNLSNDKIIINWDNWVGDDIFIKLNNSFYQEIIYEKNKYNFIHSEWTDICLIYNNVIIRKNITNEKGLYKLNCNKIIINWEKWDGDDIFINLFDNYYQKILYEKYIENYNIREIILEYENYTIECLLNEDNKNIFNKIKLANFGNYSLLNKYMVITWPDRNEKFVEINYNHYKIMGNNIVYEKYKKINNEYYIDKNCKSDTNLNNKIYNYKILDFKNTNNNINNGLNHLINNIDILNNKRYLNIHNINTYLSSFKYTNDLNNFTELNLNFEIPDKTTKRCLSLVEWGYPPFGGGENWLLNFSKLLHNNNYDNYLICFSDPFKNEYFTETCLINLDYVKIIQMPKDMIEIIKIVKLINPDIINHQGIYREFFMKISNILEIPFLTGFCFWQNIIKFNQSNININMLSNSTLEKTDEFNDILKNSYTYISSDFVNDIIHHLYNIKLDVIETISLKNEFYIDPEYNDYDIKKYVTLINSHNNKGGYLLKYLFENLDINIPLLVVYTEYDPVIDIGYLMNLLNERNIKKNINKIITEKIDIKIIYRKTRILLIPSLCEETFCKVGYEGMINKIPILSTSNGNLKYLLKNYSIFIEDFNFPDWKYQIENLYYNIDLIKNYSYKYILDSMEDVVENKILNKITNIKESKYKLNEKNIGLIIPWADQGLGIQGREYYITLKELGYTPFVLSFRPYHATYHDLYLQSNKDEWDYENITYSDNIRENLSYDEIFDFVYKNNIKQIIIIEGTFINIFKLSLFLKLINVKIYLVVNIECIRMIELSYHNIYDRILTNNLESECIMSNMFKNKSKYLGFNLNHPYFKEINKHIRTNLNKIKFCCIGGLNSITRKNINLIISAFYNIFEENINRDWELNVYIQGVELPNLINNYQCECINYHIKNFTYKEIVNSYYNNDIFIHMGSHEGLGLGFFEALYCGTPILTIDWTPNNEIIDNYSNGWLIDCSFSEIYDNDNSFINKGIVHEDILKNKINEILTDKDNTLQIINNTINNKGSLYDKNKNIFNKNLIDILSS